MTKVAKALTDYTFTVLNVHKVEIQVAVENTKSRSILERLHFVKEGFIRQVEWLYNHYVDHVVYGVLAHKWFAVKEGDTSHYGGKQKKGHDIFCALTCHAHFLLINS